MMERVTARRQQTLPARWRQAIAAVACVLVVHQLLMASALHPVVMPAAEAMGEREVAACEACAPQAMPLCAAVQAAPRLFIAIAVALVGVAALTRTSPLWSVGARVRAAWVDWRWPPDRRRALLQVFRC